MCNYSTVVNEMIVLFCCNVFNDIQLLLFKFKFIFKLSATNWLTLVSWISHILKTNVTWGICRCLFTQNHHILHFRPMREFSFLFGIRVEHTVLSLYTLENIWGSNLGAFVWQTGWHNKSLRDINWPQSTNAIGNSREPGR